MLSDELKAITSTRKDLRNFGLVVGAAFVLLGGWAHWKGKSAGLWLEGAGFLLAFLGAFLPAVLKPLQKAWMTLAVLMGFVMTRVILAILFFGALTPIALVAKVTGKRFLDQIDVHSASYWRKRDGKAVRGERFEKQF